MDSHIAAFRAFNRFYTNILGLLDQHYLDSDFSLTEVRVLFELNYAKEEVTGKDLIALLKLDKGYLSRILLNLEKHKLISKQKSVRDGRALIVTLTSKGKQVFNELDGAAGQQAKQMLQSISADKVSELIKHMNAIQQILITPNITK